MKRILWFFLIICISGCGLENGIQRSYIISQSPIEELDINHQQDELE